MNILYLTGREHTYTRNDVLLRAFRQLGNVDVVGNPQHGSLLWNSLSTALAAIPRLLSQRYDLIFVGFYGHLLMLSVGLLARGPVLFDAFVSTYDTLSSDRRVFAPDSLPGRLAFWLDRIACHRASHVLVDTQGQVDYFTKTFDLPGGKVSYLPVGCNEDLFSPRGTSARTAETPILYYSTYQPLHGVDIVIQAAALLLPESQIRFKLIGTGPDYARIRHLAQELELDNITFMPFVPLETLAAEIAAASICLGGPFGSSGKAGRVIPGKIYQILAMGRPLIAAETPANCSLLTHGETAYLCPPNSAEALANAILKMHQDPILLETLAVAGHNRYRERCSEAIITAQLGDLVRRIGQVQ